MRRFLRDNGLSIVVFALFFAFLLGHSIAGFFDYNSTEKEHGRPPVGYTEYLRSGDFVEAVFENWESEFLQMGLYVLLSPSSSTRKARRSPKTRRPKRQSKPTPGSPGTARTPLGPSPLAHPPWPIRRGGLALKLYERTP